MSGKQNVDFHQLLGPHVRRMKKRQVSLKAIAARAQYTPAYFREIRRGKHPPKDREAVRRIARALELSSEQTNVLLDAAGFGRLTDHEAKSTDAALQVRIGTLGIEAAKILEEPDKEIFFEILSDQMDCLEEAWQGYLEARAALYRREWGEVSEQVEHGLVELFQPLRRQSARYFGYLSLLKVAADQYRGEFEEARRTGTAALHAAEVAGDPLLLCRCYTRLGDVYKYMGRFTDAARHYEMAADTLRKWAKKTPIQAQWALHWQARVDRKLATLYLFQGRAGAAISHIEQGIASFKELDNQYELSRAYYALGWALSDQGRWEEARHAHREGLTITSRLARNRTWRDNRQLLEGYIGLASDALHEGNYKLASGYLKDGLRLVGIEAPPASDKEMKGPLASYHEVGRLFLLLGKLHHYNRASQDLVTAEAWLQAALRFHQKPRGTKDPARMASIHNELAQLYLDRPNVDGWKARVEAEQALSWTNAADPPLVYYKAAALVTLCAVLLRIHMPQQKTLGEVRLLAREANNLCLKYEYWGQKSRLHAILALYSMKLERVRQAANHAGRALVTAAKFNPSAAEQTVDRLESGMCNWPVERRWEFVKYMETFVASQFPDYASSPKIATALERIREGRSIVH